MFERYTDHARRVLFFARYEASQLGHRAITPEHLLLGLIREGKGLHTRILNRTGLTTDELRREIEARLVFQEKLPTSVEIPFTDPAKRSLQLAAMEADRLLHNYIGTEHLLLGLLHERQSIAAEILNAHGLGLDDVREEIVILLNQKASRSGLAGGLQLRDLLAQALHIEPGRIDLPADLDRRLSLTRERRTVDAYVLTVVTGYTLTSHGPEAGGGEVSFGSFDFSTASTLSREEIPEPTVPPSIYSLGPLSMHGAPIGEVAKMLENLFGRPVIDESGLEGCYDVEVSGPHPGIDAFLAALQREAGLMLTRATLEVEIIVIA